MALFELLIGVPLMAGFALLGRWFQLHPEKIVPKGWFTAPDSFGARLFRAQVFFVGTFAVLGGTWGLVIALVSAVPAQSVAVGWIAQVLGLCAGVAAVIHVRREVRKSRNYVSDTPNGWWP